MVYEKFGNYEIEVEDAIKKIKKEKAKTVLLQFPDALKRFALEIAEEIENKTKAKCLIWMGSCFGSCDIPNLPDKLKKKVDLLLQFGHTIRKK